MDGIFEISSTARKRERARALEKIPEYQPGLAGWLDRTRLIILSFNIDTRYVFDELMQVGDRQVARVQVTNGAGPSIVFRYYFLLCCTTRRPSSSSMQSGENTKQEPALAAQQDDLTVMRWKCRSKSSA